MTPKAGGPARKFDWDEARRLRNEEGLSYPRIAKRMGVHPNAVRRALNPKEARQQARYKRERSVGKGVCPNCGGPMNLVSQKRGKVCRSCANEQRRTSVRPDELWCFVCKTWKPDEEFPHNKKLPHRRFRHRTCRPCNTAERRKYARPG